MSNLNNGPLLNQNNVRDGIFRQVTVAQQAAQDGPQTIKIDQTSVVFGGTAALSQTFPASVHGTVTQVGALVTVIVSGTFVQTSSGNTTILINPTQILPSATASPLAALDRSTASGASISSVVLTPTSVGASLTTVSTSAPSAVNFSVTYTYVAANPFCQ